MEEIEKTITDFTNQHMVCPKSLYLGQIQFDKLHKLAERISIFDLRAFPNDEISRAEYKGMKVYLVDANDYVACGY